MARPLYEDDGDRAREREVAKEICKLLDCQARKLPISYGLDFALLRGEDVFSFVEIKCRTRNSQLYESLMVSAQKRVKALELSRATGCSCMLVSAFSDGIYWVNMAEKPDRVTFNGRTDRGDSQDVEPVIHYRTERLQLISTAVVTAVSESSP